MELRESRLDLLISKRIPIKFQEFLIIFKEQFYTEEVKNCIDLLKALYYQLLNNQVSDELTETILNGESECIVEFLNSDEVKCTLREENLLNIFEREFDDEGWILSKDQDNKILKYK
jgi:hypothetical protein